jgi:sporulation protein YlmC with PRC-barrel domain
MSTTKLTAATLAAMVAISLSTAYAQTPTTPRTTDRMAAAGEVQMKPDQVRASKFIGSTVYDVQNRNIGSVKDLLFARDGRIDEAVVDVGTFLGMGGKYVTVKLGDIKNANNRLTLDMTKEQLKAAPEFKFPDTSSTGSSMQPSNQHR